MGVHEFIMMGLHLGVGDFALFILGSDFAAEGMVMSSFQKMDLNSRLRCFLLILKLVLHWNMSCWRLPLKYVYKLISEACGVWLPSTSVHLRACCMSGHTSH